MDFANSGWVKCANSGVVFHPAHNVGCGVCLSCIEKETQARLERERKEVSLPELDKYFL